MTKCLVPGDPRSLGGYWLAGRLGAGGRGVVYDAYDDEGRRFAVKVPRGEVTQQLTDAVLRVRPCHLARVVDVGVDGTVPYIVSEFVEGPDLRRAVARHGPYEGAELGVLAVAVATALRTLHAIGVAHRDLRPESVLLSPGGPTLIDLGLGGAGMLGTPTYLAPEVITGERPGPAADVFAWGGVMLFAATGRDPFHGESLGGVMHRLLAVDPDLEALPGGLRELVGRALDKRPADRPSADALLAGLASLHPTAPALRPVPDPRPGGGRDAEPDAAPAGSGAEGTASERSGAAVVAVLRPAPRDTDDGGVTGAAPGPRLVPPGGLAGPPALGELAERVYESLTPRQRERLPVLLLRLLDGCLPDGDGAFPAPAGDAPAEGCAAPAEDADEAEVLAKLTDAGLLVRRSVPVRAIRTEVGTLVAVTGGPVAPAGAALVRAWPRLGTWTAETRAARPKAAGGTGW
ncbi:serine/threonine protein kinase [Nonomuraea sp. NPDC047897]|uniref:serine/threonine protein kinase n=1 Tax=Nonomuraea sp. NPDC047897 TaxID=3364346 RepID=UPI00371CD0C0